MAPRLALSLFVAAWILAVFFAGMYIQQIYAFPAPVLGDAIKTLRVLAAEQGVISLPMDESELDEAPAASVSLDRLRKTYIGLNLPAAGIPRAQVAAARVKFLAGDSLADPVLVQGGRGRFLDLCPEAAGCLAVAYAGNGEVVHAYPYYPDALEAANIVAAADYPYERLPGRALFNGITVIGMDVYPNGDLLVVFDFSNAFPDGGGVARIAPDGQPRWYRQDFSHHWPFLDAAEIALVPGNRVGREQAVAYSLRGTPGKHVHNMTCGLDRLRDDYVSLIDGQGQLLQAISVLDALAASPYGGILHRVRDECDPTHLNFVHRLGPDAGGAPGLQPGDIVISLRNLDAFAVLDRDDYRVKRFVRGSFLAQHGVQHLGQAQFLLFDNWGVDWQGGPSRLLRVDLATGAETTLFPVADTPAHLVPRFAKVRGQFDISPDRRRILLADMQGNRGLEIRLADGEVLTIFRNLHDVAPLSGMPPEHKDVAWHFKLYTLMYGPTATE